MEEQSRGDRYLENKALVIKGELRRAAGLRNEILNDKDAEKQTQEHFNKYIEKVKNRGREKNIEETKRFLKKIAGAIDAWKFGTAHLSREDRAGLLMLDHADGLLAIAEQTTLIEDLTPEELGVHGEPINYIDTLRAAALGIVRSPEFHKLYKERE